MPTRQEMEAAIARQYGFPDYETFRREAAQTLGKGIVNRLEKSLAKYDPPQPAPEPAPGARPAPQGPGATAPNTIPGVPT